MIACSPLAVPYSETVALGYFAIGTHLPPSAVNVLHVLQTFSAEHLVSTLPQKPSVDSLEQARYGLHVSYTTPPALLWIHWFTIPGDPPWHDPAIDPQFNTCCTDRLMSTPLPFLAILILSPSAEIGPWAQHDPQYWGMCWFRFFVKKFVPFTLPQLKFSGIAPTYVCGWGLITTSL
ncbi:hypothetical protein DIPPA_19052 [Diplonema papillatum]|nr:hypothetical protein DIPPA_19052 [Diplonema papillatum]KAJ9451047.1 hypothetical protein DIPPA_19052 [Diplonema papillatum]